MLRLFARGALAALIAGACILPPPVAVEDQPNQEPVINIAATSPAEARITLNLLCASCTFRLQVDDPDLGDTLYARWFLDYDLGGDGSGRLEECPQDFNPPTTPGAARDPITCEFRVDRFPATDTGGAHALEAWISDRPFNNNDPLGRSTPTAANVTVRQWMVTLQRRGLTCDDLDFCVARVNP